MLLLSGFVLLPSAQAETVGTVKTVTGEAWVISGGQRVKAEAGTSVLLAANSRPPRRPAWA
jgi:mannose-6-phosphate isomerase class I